MGLLDGVMGEVMGQAMGGQQGDRNAMLGMVTALIQEHGGLAGLLQKFEQSGMAEQVASWVGTGVNLPIQPEQIAAVLGGGTLGNLAEKFGVTPDQVSNTLAELLPKAVDHLTPGGRVVQADTLDSLANALGGLLKA
jgi:uncharacterized protein YidB (DUF937 family)